MIVPASFMQYTLIFSIGGVAVFILLHAVLIIIII